MSLKDVGILFENEEEYVYPDSINKKLDQLISETGTLPEWAHNLACAMPNWGFEPCSHRWADGLDEILYSIKESKYIRTMAGHCGDVPTSIYNGVITMLSEAECGTSDGKQKACFGALKELFEARQISHDKMKECYQNNHVVFSEFFRGNNAESLITTGISSSCGFKVPSIIETLIQHVSTKDVQVGPAEYNCLASFRYATDSEWERIGALIGIMRGLKSFLEKTHLTTDKIFLGYAKRTFDCLSSSQADALVVEFLAIHFFYSLNRSYHIVFDRFGEYAPAGYELLPELNV